MKSSMDGEKRKGYPLQTIIGLDVSGSMGAPLSARGQSSRLELAKNAIRMFNEKLAPQDSLGLLTFHTEADVVYPLTIKSETNQAELEKKLQNIKAGGGTRIESVFHQSLSQFLESNVKVSEGQIEKRIILITDVMDDQFTSSKALIETLAEEHQIHTTIIGISSDFQSQYCENLVQIRGFNYFCAVEDLDLMKFVVDQFDYTFFPFAFNTTLRLESSTNLLGLEIYGTPDYEDVNKKYSDLSAL